MHLKVQAVAFSLASSTQVSHCHGNCTCNEEELTLTQLIHPNVPEDALNLAWLG